MIWGDKQGDSGMLSWGNKIFETEIDSQDHYSQLVFLLFSVR